MCQKDYCRTKRFLKDEKQEPVVLPNADREEIEKILK